MHCRRKGRRARRDAAKRRARVRPPHHPAISHSVAVDEIGLHARVAVRDRLAQAADRLQDASHAGPLAGRRGSSRRCRARTVPAQARRRSGSPLPQYAVAPAQGCVARSRSACAAGARASAPRSAAAGGGGGCSPGHRGRRDRLGEMPRCAASDAAVRGVQRWVSVGAQPKPRAEGLESDPPSARKTGRPATGFGDAPRPPKAR